MLKAIPAMPVKDIPLSVSFYCDKLGFTLIHQEDGFAVLLCGEVQIHLWAATDESWRSRTNPKPIISGAESFIAGTASCRICVEGVDELFHQFQKLNILHKKSQLKDKWWGDREFGIVDLDNNLITFFEVLNSFD